MAVVEFIFDLKSPSWLTGNTNVPKLGEPIFLSNGKYALGDGVTQVQSLPLYGGATFTFTGTISQYVRGDGSYATFPTNVSTFTNDSGYITSSALTPYLTISNAASTYQPLAANLTSWSSVTRASGFDTFTTTPSSANLRSLMTDKTGTGLTVFATSPTFTTSIITPLVTGVSGALGFSNAAKSSGSVTDYTFTKANHTGQTASTNIPGFLFTTGSRQWATGAITAQEEIRITSPTYSFVGASTITDAYSLYVNAPTAGSNATITNNWALGLDNNMWINSSSAAIYLGNITTSSTNYALKYTNTNEVSLNTPSTGRIRSNNTICATWSSTDFNINGIGGLSLSNNSNDSKITFLRTGGNTYSFQHNVSTFYIYNNTQTTALLSFLNSGQNTFSAVAATSGAINSFVFNVPSNTGQTASTEINGYLYNSYSRQWAAGAINNQRERYYKTVTYSFASASTITNAYGAYFEAPTAGTNATINNNWSLGTNGNLLCQGSLVSSSPSGGVGYFIGAGSTVTQITSRTTGVTINNVCGAITLVSAAGTTTWQSFTVTNSRVTATDVIIVNQGTGTDLYQIFITNVAAGSFQITFATTGGTTTEQPVFNFSIIKAVTT